MQRLAERMGVPVGAGAGVSGTTAARTRAGAGASTMGSCQTLPVNESAGGRRESVSPQRVMSMGLSLKFRPAPVLAGSSEVRIGAVCGAARQGEGRGIVGRGSRCPPSPMGERVAADTGEGIVVAAGATRPRDVKPGPLIRVLRTHLLPMGEGRHGQVCARRRPAARSSDTFFGRPPLRPLARAAVAGGGVRALGAHQRRHPALGTEPSGENGHGEVGIEPLPVQAERADGDGGEALRRCAGEALLVGPEGDVGVEGDDDLLGVRRS